MKKSVFIMLAMFLTISTIGAKKNETVTHNFDINYYSYNNAINFFEGGIEFYVFINGDFDFYTNHTNRRIRIDRDFQGRIRRIKNVRLRYDFRGNVTRIGNIRINYFRNRLSNVGNLQVQYDRWGQPIFYGNVRNFYYDNGIRFNVNFGDVCNYNDPYFFRNDFRRNYTQFREDRNFYYYKARPNARIGKRSTIIKRRKQAVVRNNNIIRRNNNTIYRKKRVKRSLNANRKMANAQRKSVRRTQTESAKRFSDAKRGAKYSPSRSLENKKSSTTSRRKYERSTQ